VESSPSPPDVEIQQAPSPPPTQEAPQVEETQLEEPQQEVPQPEDTSADVHEPTIDPAGSIIASMVSSVQTSTVLPQGNIFTKLIPMNPSFHLIMTFNFQLMSFHRQPWPINL
jgi:hypothetical protein